jgi:uncharacterized protein YdeI (YjbR/CyaY-like superfamily)
MKKAEKRDAPLSLASRAGWRRWLSANAGRCDGVWLVVRKQKASGSGVAYLDALEEAICFGWIDGKLVRRDRDSFLLRFSPRRPKSIWSKGNKERAVRLMKAGRMEQAGLAAVREAKACGTWDRAYTATEELKVPRDLRDALKANPQSWAGFSGFPRSARYIYTRWVLDSKKPETRRRRIQRTVMLSAMGRKPGDQTDRKGSNSYSPASPSSGARRRSGI